MLSNPNRVVSNVGLTGNETAQVALAQVLTGREVGLRLSKIFREEYQRPVLLRRKSDLVAPLKPLPTPIRY